MVSIIIPYSEDRGYLTEAIQSVENQTYTDLELILSHSNASSGVNMQNGIDRASGEFICYLCEDDLLTPNSIEDRVTNIGTFDFIHSRGMRLYSNGHQKPYGGTQENVTLESLLISNGIMGGTGMYRTEMLKELGWRDYWTSCEFLNHVRYLFEGKKIGFVDTISYIWRQHDKQKSIGNLSQDYQKKRKEYRQQQLKTLINEYTPNSPNT